MSDGNGAGLGGNWPPNLIGSICAWSKNGPQNRGTVETPWEPGASPRELLIRKEAERELQSPATD